MWKAITDADDERAQVEELIEVIKSGQFAVQHAHGPAERVRVQRRPNG
jgi:hypothetical protein